MILPKSNDLDIESFSNIIDLNYLQNSYKIYWLYGIFDIIKNEKLKDENYEITFEKLVYRMLAKS